MDREGVTTVSISQKMFQLFGSSELELEGLDLQDKTSLVEGLQIITTDKQETVEAMNRDIATLPNLGYEELMHITDEGSLITFYIKEEGTLIRELLMTVEEESESVVIRLAGKFTLQDIQDITQQMREE